MLIPIIIALFGTSALNVGFLFQKSDISHLPSFSDQSVMQFLKLLLNCKKWLFGSFLTSTGWLLFLLAVSLAPLSVIAPLNNVGVVILAIFAVVYLNESLRVYEWVGFAVILIGVIFIPLFSSLPTENLILYDEIMLVSLTVLFLVGLFLFKATQTTWFPTKSGSVLGIASGITAGLGTTYTKLLSLVLDEIVTVIIIFLIIIVFQILSFISLQTAFREERATVVVPLFNSFSALLPIIFGVGVFYEVVPLGQLLGILMIVVGSSLLFQYSGKTTHSK